MGKVFAYGYGIPLGDLEFRADGASRLLDAMSDKRLKRLIRDWKKNSPDIPLEEYLRVILISDGPEKMIADIINENRFEKKKIVTGTRDALFAVPVFPGNANEKSFMPLEKEVKDAMADHLILCYKGVRKRDIDYYYFEEE